jgi:hypothetical protein
MWMRMTCSYRSHVVSSTSSSSRYRYQLIDRRPGARLALLIDLVEQPPAHLLGSLAAVGTVSTR